MELARLPHPSGAPCDGHLAVKYVCILFSPHSYLIHTLFIPYPYLIHTLFPIPYSHLYRKDTLSNSNGGDARILKVLKEEVVYSRCVVRIFLEGGSKRKCTFPI